MSDKHLKHSGSRSAKSRKLFLIWLIPLLLLVIVLSGLYSLRRAADMKAKAGIIKRDVKEVAAAFVTLDGDRANQEIDDMNRDLKDVSDELNGAFWRFMGAMPIVGGEIDSVRTLLNSAALASDTILSPMADTLSEHPIKRIYSDEGLDSASLRAYLDLYYTICPEITALADSLKTVKLHYADSDGKITGYLNAFIFLEENLQKVEEQIGDPLVDRLYSYLDSETEAGSELEFVSEFLDDLASRMPALTGIIHEADFSQLQALDQSDNISRLADQTDSLSSLLVKVNEKLLIPTIRQLSAAPLSELHQGSKINVRLIQNYLNFADDIVPEASALLDEFAAMDLSSFDKDGKLDAYVGKAYSLLEKYQHIHQYFPLVHSVIGNGEDKAYLFVAQNSSEMRASGGFPGSMGTITIEDGYLTIGEFQSVYYVINPRGPVQDSVTSEEVRVFGQGCTLAWDFGHIPDFPRVADFWAGAYQIKEGFMVDGVISLTPAIIQEVLRVLGEITLSDGTVLNGENATYVLQFGIYDATYNRARRANAWSADAIFSETADKTFSLLTDCFSNGSKLDLAKKMLGLFEAFENCIKARTAMLWFSDEADQKICEELKCDGGLNQEPENPQLGIYFSGLNPCKLGWWVDIEPVISEPLKNADNSLSYDVTVTFRNTIPEEALRKYTAYILGNYDGKYSARISIFAPCGGTISEIEYEDICKFYPGTYNGLSLYFIEKTFLPGDELVAHFTITTAPGVDAPLGLSMTPTLTQYR